MQMDANEVTYKKWTLVQIHFGDRFADAKTDLQLKKREDKQDGRIVHFASIKAMKQYYLSKVFGKAIQPLFVFFKYIQVAAQLYFSKLQGNFLQALPVLVKLEEVKQQ